MQDKHRYTREELFAIGRNNLEELVDFTFALQDLFHTSSKEVQKQIDALKADIAKHLTDRQ